MKEQFQIIAAVLFLYCPAFGDSFKLENACEGMECIEQDAEDIEELGTIFGVPDSKMEEDRFDRSVGLEQNLRLEDVKRIAQYFMNGGPMTGSPFQQCCDLNKKDQTSEEPCQTPQSESPVTEIPGLPFFHPEDPIVSSKMENPWCPVSIFGRSPSRSDQPPNVVENPHSFNNIVGASQEKIEIPAPCGADIIRAPSQLFDTVKNCESEDPNIEPALPVQPVFTYPKATDFYSAPEDFAASKQQMMRASELRYENNPHRNNPNNPEITAQLVESAFQESEPSVQSFRYLPTVYK